MKETKNGKKKNYYADAETLAAIEILKEHHISISAVVQDTIKKKAEQLKQLSDKGEAK